MRRFLLPLGIFIALLLFLGVGLRLNPREIPSPFIGKPAPAFQLSQLHEPGKNISPQEYQELLTRARSLGVRGNITPTTQYS